MLLFVLLFNFFLQLVLGADTEAWKSRSIYFVLTDRIARGQNDGQDACGNLGNYCGGTFKGLESKLDYIKGLGFDAIWITPIVQNSPGGYHGYWAKDLYAVNENYGTADDLKSLVSAAHEKGMYVMCDVVANHMGQGPISENRPEPLNQDSSYHSNCQINYNDQSSVEQCRIANLPDLNTGSSTIRNLLNSWIKWLVQEYQFDGIRFDTVKHIEKDFWPAFAQAAGVYSIGEVWDGDPDYLAGYARLMPGLLNYAIYYPMNNFYQQKGSSQDLVNMIDRISSTFPDPSALGNFIDNHDNARWLSQKNDQTLLMNALAFVVLSRGIPILYYGTEQGYTGGNDPANREDLWRSGYSRSSRLYQSIAKLNAARQALGGLGRNDHVHLYTTNTVYAWAREDSDLIVLTSNGGASSSGQHCFNSRKPNAQWTDVYSDSSAATVRSDGSGNICLTISNGNPIVLVAATASNPGSPPPTSTPTGCADSVSVTFNHRVQTAFGETVKITGNNSQLGNWLPASAPTLNADKYTSSNPIWSVTLSMKPGQVVYKFVKVAKDGSVTWESDPNRAYTVPSCQQSATVNNEWR